MAFGELNYAKINSELATKHLSLSRTRQDMIGVNGPVNTAFRYGLAVAIGCAGGAIDLDDTKQRTWDLTGLIWNEWELLGLNAKN